MARQTYEEQLFQETRERQEARGLALVTRRETRFFLKHGGIDTKECGKNPNAGLLSEVELAMFAPAWAVLFLETLLSKGVVQKEDERIVVHLLKRCAADDELRGQLHSEVRLAGWEAAKAWVRSERHHQRSIKRAGRDRSETTE